jgi:hypothetical protein
MKKIILFLLISGSVVFTSCGSSSTEVNADSLKAANDNKQKCLDDIKAAETAMANSKEYDSKLALEALRAYNTFFTKFPKDTMAAEYLFKASDIAQGTGNYQQAAIYLETILDQHTGYRKYPDAAFAAAHVYDEYLEGVNNGGNRAIELYDFIMEKYPSSPYAEQSRILKQYVGKPDSVLINDIMRKAQEQEKK